MANQDHMAILERGKSVWNNWRKENRDIIPDLSETSLRHSPLIALDLEHYNLSGAKLIGSSLKEMELQGVDLRNANLYNAYLYGANLQNANLQNANLMRADCRLANFNGAKLQGVSLNSTNLGGATLINATLRNAILSDTIFGNTNLLDISDLDKCNHWGPSTIDLRTLKMSYPLPVSFLRGCGLPENFIESLPFLLQVDSQFYSCFISYSTKDQEFAERLYGDLQENGVRCWFAPHDIHSGKKIHEQIQKAIWEYDCLLIVLSKDSMQSEWVKTEISNARSRELKELRQILFPIRLVDFETIRNWQCFDVDTGKDTAREIREYFIPDFSNWKDLKKYEESIKALIRDLKAENSSHSKGTS